MASSAALAAPSNAQLTCSNMQFTYLGNSAGITATCLRADGTPNNTQIAIQGISNQNGNLSMTDGNSTFQQSCGNIRINAELSGIVLTAFCRRMDGSFNATSIPVMGIQNLNGKLSY